MAKGKSTAPKTGKSAKKVEAPVVVEAAPVEEAAPTEPVSTVFDQFTEFMGSSIEAPKCHSSALSSVLLNAK